jgi:murein DD-endopeptidase MepM/ murein hydrolase activator NlpD
MGTGIRADRGCASAPLAMAILGLLAACAPAMRGPAPVVYGGANPPGSPVAAPTPGVVVVQPGQSLSIIARTYHLGWPALAAANHLTPPYRVKPGQQLVIPGAGVYAATPPPAVAVAALPPPAAPHVVPSREAAVATSPERPKAVATRPPPRMIPLDTPASLGEVPARGQKPLAVAAAEAPPHVAPGHSPGHSPGKSFDRPIPLDNPIGAVAAGTKPATPRTAAAGRGDFLWPVRGPIVEGFGAGPDGTRNEGINIAAPRNAPVRAADAGVVAYVGNELRGYGNLILIKHSRGWISAYAHCGAVLVKPGEKVRRGQIIARVGATGDVRTPQLHFELRRGKQAVDPRPLLGQPPAGMPATAGDGGRARPG